MSELHVAVVDAEGSFGELVTAHLREQGAVVTVVASPEGLAGRRVSDQPDEHESGDAIGSPFDAVVTCEDPPGESVEAVLDAVPRTPVVALVSDDEEAGGGAVDAGAVACLSRTPEAVATQLAPTLRALVATAERAGYGLDELVRELNHDLVGVARRETVESVVFDALGDRFAAVAITREDGERFHAVAGADPDAWSAPASVRERDPTARAARTRLAAVEQDLRGTLLDDDGAAVDVSADGVPGAALAVPIGEGAEYHGVLTVYAAEPFAFGPRDVLRLTALGDTVSRAYTGVETRVALEAAEDENDRLRTVLDAVGDAVFVLDADGRIVETTAAGAGLIATPQRRVVGRPIAEFLAIDAATFRDRLDRAFEGGEAWVETSVTNGEDGDGVGTPIELRVSPIGGEEAVAVVHEVGHRRRAERTLRRLREGLRALIDASDETTAAEVAVDTLADAVGASAVAFLLDEETGALQPVASTDDVTTAPTAITSRESFRWGVFESGEARRFTDAEAPTVLPAETAVAVPVGSHGLLIATADDATDEYVRVVADDLAAALNELAAREALRGRSETLERRNRLLDEFAAIVAHDLRNPLGAAMGFLDLARETGDDSHFARVERAHERMEDLVTQLLELARSDGRIDPDRVAFADLREDVRSAWSHVATGDATLVVEESQLVRADHDLLQELFENLFRNAVEHAGSDVVVTVGVLDDGFYVEDDGPGIPDEVREELAAIERVTTERGIGFGLSIVARIARGHDWDLHIGESVAGGARFEFTDAELKRAEVDD